VSPGFIAASMIALATAGAAVTLTHEPRQPAEAGTPQPAAVSVLPPGRIALTPAQVREAYRAGLIDRPIKSILDIRQPMEYGEFRWNDRGVPAGPIWIRIDLKSQLLSVFRAGHEIGTAVILYGTDGLPTPTGKFPILAKWKDHRSATYDNAPMPYTLRLTKDGVAIHGSNVRWGFATHGCIGIPTDFAAKVFGVVHVGDPVLIVSGKPHAKAS
jgi:lipoprotein-anchoring transpeptidase ErfK/SrfK